MLSVLQSKCVVRGRIELHERVSTMDENKNPKDGRLPGLRGEGQDRLNDNCKAVGPPWEKRGGWEKVAMISQGVEISMAGGGEDMLSAYRTVSFLFYYYLILYPVLLVKVQELACIVRYGVKKTLIASNRQLHHFRGKIKHLDSIGKVPLTQHLRQ